MKNTFFLFAILIILVACKQPKQSVIEQNNAVVADINAFYKLHDNLFLLFDSDTTAELYFNAYDSLIHNIKFNLAKYDTISPAANDNMLVNAVRDFFSAYSNLAYNEYNTLLHILAKPRYLFTAKDISDIDSLYWIISKKQDSIDRHFQQQQNEYLLKYQLLNSDSSNQ